MIRRIRGRGLAVGCTCLCSAFLVRALADDAAAAKGDLWETTSQMSMEGMPMQMPVQKLKVCAAKNRTEPPGASNPQHNCTNSNMKRVGDKVTWDVQCTQPDMTGQGEINYSGTDAYTGSIKFVAEQGNMTIKLTGHKTGGCDHPQ
jgi:hypothetical protein